MISVNNEPNPGRGKRKCNRQWDKKCVEAKRLPFRFPEPLYIVMFLMCGMIIEIVLIMLSVEKRMVIAVMCVYGITAILWMYRVCAFRIGRTLMAVRKSGRVWKIHMMVFAFLGVAAEHRKPLPMLRQMMNDFTNNPINLPPGTTIIIDTWIMNRHSKMYFLEAGYNIKPLKIDFVKLGMLWPIWQVARLLMEDRKSMGPFAKHRHFHRIIKRF